MDRIGCMLASMRIAAVLPHVRGKLLDIGCGSNRLARIYGNGIGVDVYNWGNVDYVVQDTASLPFENKSFMTITIIAALNHIPNREAVLKECHRLLMDGGQLILTMIPPFISAVWHKVRSPWDVDQQKRGMHAGEVYGLTFEQTQSLCVQAGFILNHHARFMLGINSLYIFKKRA